MMLSYTSARRRSRCRARRPGRPHGPTRYEAMLRSAVADDLQVEFFACPWRIMPRVLIGGKMPHAITNLYLECCQYYSCIFIQFVLPIRNVALTPILIWTRGHSLSTHANAISQVIQARPVLTDRPESRERTAHPAQLDREVSRCTLRTVH